MHNASLMQWICRILFDMAVQNFFSTVDLQIGNLIDQYLVGNCSGRD